MQELILGVQSDIGAHCENTAEIDKNEVDITDNDDACDAHKLRTSKEAEKICV